MKLHLPHKLRNSLMACICSVAALGTTLTTGTLAGGAIVAAVAGQAAAAEYTVTDRGVDDSDENVLNSTRFLDHINADDAIGEGDTVTIESGGRVTVNETTKVNFVVNATSPDAGTPSGLIFNNSGKTGGKVTGAVTIGTSGGSVIAWNEATIEGALTLNGLMTVGVNQWADGALKLTGSVAGSGGINLAHNAATLTFGTNASISTITGGHGTVNIESGKTLTLTGDGSSVGTLNNAGTIAINGNTSASSYTGAGTYTVADNKTFTVGNRDKAMSISDFANLLSKGDASVEGNGGVTKITSADDGLGSSAIKGAHTSTEGVEVKGKYTTDEKWSLQAYSALNIKIKEHGSIVANNVMVAYKNITLTVDGGELAADGLYLGGDGNNSHLAINDGTASFDSITLQSTGSTIKLNGGKLTLGGDISGNQGPISLLGGTLSASDDWTAKLSTTLGSGLIIDNSGYTITLGDTGTTTTLNGVVTNNGSLVINGHIALGSGFTPTAQASSISGVYSDGENGYEGTSYVLIQDGDLTTKAETVTVTGALSDGTVVSTAGGTAYYGFTQTGTGTYYINHGFENSYAEISESTPTGIVVRNNATLLHGASDDDISKDVTITLNNGHLHVGDGRHVKAALTVTGTGNTIYSRNLGEADGYAYLDSTVSGTGDLVLAGAKGSLDITGSINIGGNLSFVSGAAGEDFTRENITVGNHDGTDSSAEIANGGNIFIGDIGVSGSAAKGASVTVQSGAIIKNSGNVEVGTGGSLLLADGGVIDHQKAANPSQGAVTVSGGSLTTQGGEISTNTITVSAGSMEVENYSVLNATDSITISGGSMSVAGKRTEVSTGQLIVSGGDLVIAPTTSVAADALELNGGMVETGGSGLSVSALTLNAGTLNLTSTYTVGTSGLSISQAEGLITLSGSILQNRTTVYTDNNGNEGNGWAQSQYTVFNTSAGALTLDGDVMVTIGGDAVKLNADGTVTSDSKGGTWYIKAKDDTYSGTATSGILEAESIVLLNRGHGLNLEKSLEDGVSLSLQASSVLGLNNADVVLNDSQVTVGDGLAARLHGNGTYVMTGDVDASHLNFSDNSGRDWTGTVRLENATLDNEKLDDYGSQIGVVANSTVELKDASGSLAAGEHVANVVLTGTNTISATNGAVELSGKVSGTGTVELGAEGADYQFSGDVSKWTGEVRNAEASGATSVSFSGDAQEVNVAINAGSDAESSMEVSFNNAQNVAINGDVTGNAYVTVTGAGTKELNSATVSAKELIMNGGDVNAKNALVVDSVAVNSGTLTIGTSLTSSEGVSVAAGAAIKLANEAKVQLNSLAFEAGAKLTLGSGALNFSAMDASQTTQLSFGVSGGDAMGGIAVLTLDKPVVDNDMNLKTYVTIDVSSFADALIAEMKAESGYATLFTGVDESNWTEAGQNVTLYFGEGSSYNGNYNLQNTSGTVYIAAHVIPEPATATLSLLALAALAARRRRK